MDRLTNSTNNRKLLLAGTRLTGDKPHIGTFYGWIYQIIKASEVMDVCVIISDYQSLDTSNQTKYSITAQNLKATLGKLLPSSIPIVLESDIPSISTLGILISNLFTKSYLNRVAPFRKMRRMEKSISLNTFMYPSLMIADVLAIGATHIFDKPEGRFQHIDVLNDVLNKMSIHWGLDKLKLKEYNKRKIDIPSLDGSGPMKRERVNAGVIEVINTSVELIKEQLSKVVVPSTEVDVIFKSENCNVIKKIWDSIDFEKKTSICLNNTMSCEICVNLLAETIYSDISISKNCSQKIDENYFIEVAEQRARGLIDLIMRQ